MPFEAGNLVPLDVWGARFRNSQVLPQALKVRVQEWSLLTSIAWGSGGLLPFDPVAVSALLWPHLFVCTPVVAEVREKQLLVRTGDQSAAVQYCLPVHPITLRTYLMRTLTRS